MKGNFSEFSLENKVIKTFLQIVWENSISKLRPLPDHVTVFQWGFGKPMGEFCTNVAAIAGSCHVIVCCFNVAWENSAPTLRPLLDHVQFLSPDHLHELELGRHRLDRQRVQAPSSSTTSTAAQPSSKHKTTGFASVLVMHWSCSSPTLVRPPTHPRATHPPSRHKGPAVKCHPLCRTTMPPPHSCLFIRTACSSPPWPYAPTTIPWASPPFFHRSGKSQVPTPAYRLRCRQSVKHGQTARV